LEAALMDRNGKKIGVKKSTVAVPQPSNSLSMSDVVVVRRTDALKDNQISDAFYFPGGKVVPTLAHTLKGGPGNVLPFYFAVFPDHAVKDAPKLTMAFYKDGQYLGAAEAPLPAPQTGRKNSLYREPPRGQIHSGSLRNSYGCNARWLKG